MLQYEQAYQAAAQIISTSQSLFTSLLDAVKTA
jgi:flagellar hook-associated protein FlgK